MEKIFTSSETIEEFQWNFQERLTYDIKSYKKQGFSLSLEDNFWNPPHTHTPFKG